MSMSEMMIYEDVRGIEHWWRVSGKTRFVQSSPTVW